MHKKEYDGSVVVDGCESFKHSEKCGGCESFKFPEKCEGCNNCAECSECADVVLINEDALPDSWEVGGGETSKDTGKMFLPNTQELITEECAFVKDMLLQKNKEYGDSALNPLRIFASSDNVELINIRIDDKLSRIANRGEKSIKEDTILDLIGYLILKRIADRGVEDDR